MTLLLQSPSFELRWEPQRGAYCLQSPGRSLEGIAGVEVVRQGHAHTLSTADLPPGRVTQNALEDAHGQAEELHVHYQERQGLVLCLRVRLYPGRPFVLFRISVTNVGPETVKVRRFFLRTTPDGFHASELPVGCYVNGWQSWSPAGYLPAARRGFPPSIPLAQTSMIRNGRTPRSRRAGRFWSESVGAVVTPSEALVAGGVSLADAFVQMWADVRPGHQALLLQSQADDVPLEAGTARLSEWFYMEWVPLPNVDPLAQYAHAVARQMQVPTLRPIPPGWSSWYFYWDKVGEDDMMENLAHAALLADALPLQVIQLDEGYQVTWGDWEARNARFPHALTWLADRIQGSEFIPGLWLGPLTAHPKAQLIADHPDWILRDDRGRPVSTGLISGAMARALDPTHPGVEAHLRHLIAQAVEAWGYKYLKLDFMYAGALPACRHNPYMTRAQALHHAFRIIREAAGEETYMIGCGAPLAPAIGLVDAMRIGPDTAPEWKPRYHGVSFPFRRNPSMPGLRNSLRNVTTRAWMHNRWWINDPDVIMLRDTQTRLTASEVQAQITLIGLATNMIFFSDHLPGVPVERREMAATLFPPLLEGMDVLNLLTSPMPEEVVVPVVRPWGRWRLIGLFNWGDAPVERALPESLAIDPRKMYHIVNFWERRHFLMESGGTVPVLHIPSHGAVLLGIRSVKPLPQLVATTFHISQGGEITQWDAESQAVTLTLTLGRLAYGEIWLALPARPQTALLNDAPLSASAIHAIAPGIWAIACHVNHSASLRVAWGAA